MILLNGNNLKKSFGGETIFENVTFSVYDSDKIGLIGVNGAGKSTLFKIITGIMDSDGGELSKSRDLKIGYLEQYAVSDGNNSIMDEMLTVFSEVIEIERQLNDIRLDIEIQKGDLDELITRQAALNDRLIALDGLYYESKIKSALNGLGFAESDLSMPVSKLSGGQRTRIALCKILLSDANLLLLDEPTNHLDITSREALETALDGYDGTMLMVSHDRYFINRLADRILYLTPDGIVEYSGNYDYFAEIRQAAEEVKPEVKVEEKGLDYKERKRAEAEKRKILNRFAKVEELIEKTEAKIAELSAELNNPEYATDFEKLAEVQSKTDILQKELDGYMDEWENLQLTIDEM